jgi:glycolate oxidase FAD binding subunit
VAGIGRLADVVGPDGCLDPAGFLVCGVVPGAALAPATAEEAEQVVSLAGEAGLACIPWGSGSRVGTGGPPARYDFALSTSRLTGVVRHDPDDLTACFRAGTPLAEIRQVLGRRRQWLPWEAEVGGPVTFGGAIATNTSGAPQDGYGSPRRRILQLRAVTGYGRSIQPGAPVVKSVAGYALHRLYCGSWGTLGLILDATVQVELLAGRLSRLARLGGWEEARERGAEADRLGQALVSFTIASGADGLTGVYDLTGADAVLEWAAEKVGGEPAEPHPTEPADCAVRFVTPVAQAVGLAERLAAEHASATVLTRPVSGVTWFLSPHAADAAAAAKMGDETGAAWRVQRGRGERYWSGPGPGLPLMRRIKRAFDPSGVFSPGRFVGGL